MNKYEKLIVVGTIALIFVVAGAVKNINDDSMNRMLQDPPTTSCSIKNIQFVPSTFGSAGDKTFVTCNEGNVLALDGFQTKLKIGCAYQFWLTRYWGGSEAARVAKVIEACK